MENDVFNARLTNDYQVRYLDSFLSCETPSAAQSLSPLRTSSVSNIPSLAPIVVAVVFGAMDASSLSSINFILASRILEYSRNEEIP